MNEDQKLKALQTEFDEILTCIKPIYLNWKTTSDKNFIASWIRKLTGVKCSTVDLMHLRNLYILALFDSLRKEVLPEPFNSNPPITDLVPLPCHLKEVIENFSVKPSLNPDWLKDDELLQMKDKSYTDKIIGYEDEERLGMARCIQGTDDFKHSFTPFGMISQVKPIECQLNVTQGDNLRYADLDNNWVRYNSLRTINIRDSKVRETDMNNIYEYDTFNNVVDHQDNYDDLGLKQKTNETGYSNRVQEKEMERRLAQLQNSYHEDIMKLSSQHDIEIQSIISRKNNEMEQLRKDCNEKVNEQEYHMDQLESKANECMKQLQLFQENKLKEIEQMKKSHNEITDEQNRHHEQKVLALYEDFQKEKKQLLLEHKKKEDAINKETQDFFANVKMEFTEKSNETNKEILILERDIEELKNSKKKIIDQHEQLTIENQNFVSEIKKLHIDLNESQNRYQCMESQHKRLIETHDLEMKSMKHSLETALQKSECSREEIEARSRDKISILEKQNECLNKTIDDLKQIHRNEIDTFASNQNFEMSQIKKAYENEIDTLKSKLKILQGEGESKLLELEKKLESKEVQLNQFDKDYKLKDKLTTQMIEDLKHEMTLVHERQLRKKQFELEQIESELKYEIRDKSKEVTDLMQQLSSHKQETEIKLSDIRKWSDTQISTLTSEWKQEKGALERDYQSQLKKVHEDRRKELESVIEEKDKNIVALQNDIEKLKKYSDTQKTDFEEIIQACKKQINVLIKSHEEEKDRLDFHNQVIIENLNQQSTEWKCNIEKKHSEQVSQILSKTNEKLKEIEQEYGERSLQSFKMINDLKSVNEKLKIENQEMKISCDDQLNNFAKKSHLEIENYQKIIKANLETYKKDLTTEQMKFKELEKRLERKEHNTQRQITQLKAGFETKISKLLPIDVQVDFEETIQSLRCQISFLQQRIIILEDEVDAVNIFKSTQNNCYLKQNCDKIFEE